jgi:single-strand DNA-binding protein
MAQVIGRLTKDAVSKTTASGKTLVEFSVVEVDSYKQKNGERKEKTTFYTCTKWNTDKLSQNLTKGKAVLIEGTIEANAYTGKDGAPKASLKCTVKSLKFLPPSTKKAVQNDTPPPAVNEPASVVEDLPF